MKPITRVLFYYNTLKHLRFQQVWYRLSFAKRRSAAGSEGALPRLNLAITGFLPSIKSSPLFDSPTTFEFLNQRHTFSDKIDWDYTGNGSLWTYNLNYFEYLEQGTMGFDEGFRLIDDFLTHYQERTTGREPYPTSLRLIYWIRFFMRIPGVSDRKYLEALHTQAKELQSKLEYHLLGNHLLENAFSLVFTACYLQDRTMFRQAEKLLKKELEEQILQDGGHFELSTMYHQILTYRLLDVINMVRACHLGGAKESLPYLEDKATRMLGWMENMTFSTGGFPLFNDAAYGIAPAPGEILAYAVRLGLQPAVSSLSDSGYRKFTGPRWEMFIDAGQPGPSYQPGHAHCDALSFVLNANGKEILVDTGTSVYGGNPQQRQLERGTAAHNTVQIDGKEQSEIWGEFRIARRAKVRLERDEDNCVQASHNGFYFKGKSHTRSFQKVNDTEIRIHDTVHFSKTGLNKAFFHFHPDVRFKVTGSEVIFEDGQLSFEGGTEVKVTAAVYSPEFGKSYPSRKVVVTFRDNLITKISIQPSSAEK